MPLLYTVIVVSGLFGLNNYRSCDEGRFFKVILYLEKFMVSLEDALMLLSYQFCQKYKEGLQIRNLVLSRLCQNWWIPVLETILVGRILKKQRQIQ